MRKPKLSVTAALGLIGLMVMPRPVIGQTLERISVGPGGLEADGTSLGRPALSANGRLVAFASRASNLVAKDTNGHQDIFVHNRGNGRTTRISLGLAGTEADGDSSFPAVSADGRVVAFASQASNLVVGDTNGTWDIFVHDRSTRLTERVSVGPGGAQASAEPFGRAPGISADGRFVAFLSSAADLVANDTNRVHDAFVRDRLTATTTRVSVSSTGIEANNVSLGADLSGDGRFVVVTSLADNLVPGDVNPFGQGRLFMHDLRTGATTTLSDAPFNELGRSPSLSKDGRFVAFEGLGVPGDTGSSIVVRLTDRRTDTTTLVSQNNNATAVFPTVSANGRFVAFSAGGRDIFVRDRRTNALIELGRGPTGSFPDPNGLAMSANGEVVAFTSQNSLLVPNDTNSDFDVFVSTR